MLALISPAVQAKITVISALMSYDLTIKSDESYSRAAPKASLAAFIAQLPAVKPNGEYGFVLDDLPKRWMEIDLEVVDNEGDNVQEAWVDYEAINCIRLHIPYQFLGDAIDRDYLPTAAKIADHVGWQLYDEQTGDTIPESPKTRKPWWKVW